MDYQPVGYKLKFKFGSQILDLGGLQWADVTGSVDGRVFHFQDPQNNELDFRVTVGGRTLAMTMDGDEYREYTDEEIHLAMLLAIRDEIGRAFNRGNETAKLLGIKEGQRIGMKFPAKMDASYSHLREAVKMVHARKVN